MSLAPSRTDESSRRDSNVAWRNFRSSRLDVSVRSDGIEVCRALFAVTGASGRCAVLPTAFIKVGKSLTQIALPRFSSSLGV